MDVEERAVGIEGISLGLVGRGKEIIREILAVGKELCLLACRVAFRDEDNVHPVGAVSRRLDGGDVVHWGLSGKEGALRRGAASAIVSPLWCD